MKQSMTYAGIGSTKTPERILKLMTKIAIELEEKGYTLYSGGTDGADSAFAKEVKKKKIFIPWQGYNNIQGIVPDLQKSELIVKNIHPNWDKYSSVVKKLHARNVNQILGENLDEEVDFVICWTPNGEKTGGIATAMELAKKRGILVMNLANEKLLQTILKKLNIKEDEVDSTENKEVVEEENNSSSTDNKIEEDKDKRFQKYFIPGQILIVPVSSTLENGQLQLVKGVILSVKTERKMKEIQVPFKYYDINDVFFKEDILIFQMAINSRNDIHMKVVENSMLSLKKIVAEYKDKEFVFDFRSIETLYLDELMNYIIRNTPSNVKIIR